MPISQTVLNSQGQMETRQLDGVTASINNNIVARNEMTAATVRNSDTLASFGSGTARGAITMENFGTQIDSATKKVLLWQVAMGATYGIMSKVSESIQIWKDYELELTRIGITTNTAATGLNQYFNSAAKVAVQMGQPLKDTLTGYDQALKAVAGFTTEAQRAAVATQLLTSASMLANLTGMQLSGSMDILVAALQQSGLGMSDSMQLLDGWVAVAKTANMTVEDMAQSFAIMGDAAQAAGVDTNQLNGLVAAMAQSTTATPTGVGDALRTLMSTIYNSGSIDTLQKYGVAVTDANGDLRSFWDIMTQLAAIKQTGILSDSAWLEIGKAAGGGARNYSKFLALLNDMTLAETDAQVSANAQGDALSANNDIVGTLTNTWMSFTSATQAFMFQVGAQSGAIKDLTSVMKELSGVFSGMSHWSEGAFKVAASLGAIVAVMGAMKVGQAALGWVGAVPGVGALSAKFLGGMYTAAPGINGSPGAASIAGSAASREALADLLHVQPTLKGDALEDVLREKGIGQVTPETMFARAQYSSLAGLRPQSTSKQVWNDVANAQLPQTPSEVANMTEQQFKQATYYANKYSTPGGFYSTEDTTSAFNQKMQGLSDKLSNNFIKNNLDRLKDNTDNAINKIKYNPETDAFEAMTGIQVHGTNYAQGETVNSSVVRGLVNEIAPPTSPGGLMSRFGNWATDNTPYAGSAHAMKDIGLGAAIGAGIDQATNSKAAGLGAGIGSAFGLAVGGPIGGVAGTAIGTAAGYIIQDIFTSETMRLKNTISAESALLNVDLSNVSKQATAAVAQGKPPVSPLKTAETATSNTLGWIMGGSSGPLSYLGFHHTSYSEDAGFKNGTGAPLLTEINKLAPTSMGGNGVLSLEQYNKILTEGKVDWEDITTQQKALITAQMGLNVLTDAHNKNLDTTLKTQQQIVDLLTQQITAATDLSTIEAKPTVRAESAAALVTSQGLEATQSQLIQQQLGNYSNIGATSITNAQALEGFASNFANYEEDMKDIPSSISKGMNQIGANQYGYLMINNQSLLNTINTALQSIITGQDAEDTYRSQLSSYLTSDVPELQNGNPELYKSITAGASATATTAQLMQSIQDLENYASSGAGATDTNAATLTSALEPLIDSILTGNTAASTIGMYNNTAATWQNPGTMKTVDTATMQAYQSQMAQLPSFQKLATSLGDNSDDITTLVDATTGQTLRIEASTLATTMLDNSVTALNQTMSNMQMSYNLPTFAGKPNVFQAIQASAPAYGMSMQQAQNMVSNMIAGGANVKGSFATGGVIPETGPYTMHANETVIPNGGFSGTNNLLARSGQIQQVSQNYLSSINLGIAGLRQEIAYLRQSISTSSTSGANQNTDYNTVVTTGIGDVPTFGVRNFVVR